MITQQTSRILNAVNYANKNYEKDGKKLQKIWEERMHENFQKGQYDLAYEYVAMLELLAFKSIRKSDPFRLKMWRMFVTDFRRAFSDHEFANFHQLKELDII